MKTFRISEDEIKDLKPVAVGYKIFKNDWTAKSNGYDYKDENGNVLNTIHKVDGDISKCKWGLHFSKRPQDCFDFYESVQWNKFAKVEAYDQLLTCEKKCVTNILKIVEIYTFDEFINLMRYNLRNNTSRGVHTSNGVCGSFGVSESRGVHTSNGVCGSFGVSESSGVQASNGVDSSKGVYLSNGVNTSYGVNVSMGVNDSRGVNRASGVYESSSVYGSNGVSYSNGVSMSDGVYGSEGVNMSDGVNVSYGVDNSEGVYGSYGVMECRGISRAVFCYKKSGELMAFNKKITAERFDEIYETLNSFEWYPKFNNAEQLKGDLEWYETNIPAIKSVDNKTAWSSMPKKMLKYIKSLPEFNEKIFNKITGGEL